MKKLGTVFAGAALLSCCALLGPSISGEEQPPNIASLSVPQGGSMQILFHAKTDGPFRLQMRTTLDPSAPWLDVPEAMVTKVEPGVFLAISSKGREDIAFYRVVSETETITELKGWTLRVQVSPPANHQFFAAGESLVVTVTILDTMLQGLSRNDFSTLNLYMYGPQDPEKTVTAVKLLNASTNRAVRPHHYIDLKTNPDVQVKGNVLTYALKPVTDEAPGTYRLSVWSSLASDSIQQIMKFTDLQIGTSTVEDPVVAKSKCAACHEGTISKKVYLHHIDPGISPVGNWSLDFEPVRTCKSCHNNNGYSAYANPAAPGGRVPDPIIRRVHGVHMGSRLENTFDNDPKTGDFKDYRHLQFPADVRLCTKCHLDDRWKTQPSRLACGTCHDNLWFGLVADMPAGREKHPGGPQADDSKCATCHTADENGLAPISLAHIPETPSFKQTVDISLTPPANGKFYASGDKPQVIIKIKDNALGQLINPTNIVEPLISTNVAPNEWKRGNLFVSGPRSRTLPVLTTAAANPDPKHFYANNDVRVRVNPKNEDPRVTRTADSIVYQLDDVAGLAPGTYTAFAEFTPSAPLGGWAYVNFQVGVTNIEPMIATNCRTCHENATRHTEFFAVTFTPDICKSCHDYLRQTPGKTKWSDANMGFGAAPLARRVHGVHFGNYLDKPKEVSAIVTAFDYSNVIFPQDVRNCTKCHSESNAWTEKPSRLACFACHDADDAITHGKLMTFDPTPDDPWNGDEIETCEVCHGKDGAFTPKVVHSISNPYVPPYPRATKE